MYRLVNRHWEEFKSVYEERFEPRYGPLRPHVIRVVDEYLKCGILEWGFCRLFCEKCGRSYFLAFSCKGRCFCPSCSKKRQIAFGEFVTHEILENVPHRHANFTVPRRLRRHLYFNRKLLSKLAGCAYETLREAIQDACGPVTPGAVSVIHTAGKLLDFTPHAHLIITWGGWLGNGLFVHAPAVPHDVLETLFKHRVFRMSLDEEAISEDVVESMLQWPHSGFDAFTGPEIPGDDTAGLENLAQYISKGPVSLQNLEYSDENHEACYRSDKIHPRHGQYRSFDPLEFLAELTTHIAQPYERLTNYHGYYSNRSRGHRKKEQQVSEGMHSPSQAEIASPESPSRRTWARLIKKVYVFHTKCTGHE